MNLWLNDPAAFQDDWQELRALQREVAARPYIEPALARLVARLLGWIWGAR